MPRQQAHARAAAAAIAGTVPTGDVASIKLLATQLRVDAIRSSTAAGSGHPTSSLSAADLMAVLLARHLHYDWSAPDLPTNDHLIFSKGHASPLLYAMFRATGAIGEEELLTTYRRFGSRLQGHPTPALPWVDVATGSLGQGLPCAVGIALGRKAPREGPLSRLGPMWGRRDGGRIDVGGARQGELLRPREPDGDP